MELADRSDDAFWRTASRTTLADALHAAGRGLAGSRGHKAALAAYREAEAMQKEWQPQYPLLYGLMGYQYCDLLLDQFSVFSYQLSVEDSDPSLPNSAIERLREVRKRAEWMMNRTANDPNTPLLDIALDHLTLGRTYLLETRNKRLETRKKKQETKEVSALDSAEHHLNESVSLLRQSGQQDELPRGLLHRAALWRVKYEITKDKSQIELAERDQPEAERVAERGSMFIWRIEAALERTRLALVFGDEKQANEKLDKARELIRQTEKPYQPHTPDWEDWQPPEYIGVFKEGDIVGYHCRNREIDELRKAIDEAAAAA